MANFQGCHAMGFSSEELLFLDRTDFPGMSV